MEKTPMRSGCRLHGPSCTVRWGYDPEHTDSDHPYSVDELAVRREAPHRFAYPTVQEYEQGFHTWRAMRRDDRLTGEEQRAREPVVLKRLGIDAETFEEALSRFA